MKHVFIVNPVAGKADATMYFIPQLISELARLKLDNCAIEITKHPGDATAIVKRYAQTGEQLRFYACGGDGTLNEVAEGALGQANAGVANIPLGSGNDFNKNFKNVNFADIEALLNGAQLCIDTLKVNGKVCVNICSAGIDADVAYEMPMFRRLPLLGKGSMAYNAAVAKCLAMPIGKNFAIEMDGEKIQGRFLLCAVANGTTYGGGYIAAPEAILTDGLADVVIANKIGRLKISSVLNVYKRGMHLKNGAVDEKVKDVFRYKKCKNITIESDTEFVANIDGECHKTKRLQIEVMPLSLNVVVPRANI